MTKVSRRRLAGLGLLAIVAGGVVLVIGVGLDWGGFGGGMALGSGIGLALAGAYLLGFAHGHAPREHDAWLPSETGGA